MPLIYIVAPLIVLGFIVLVPADDHYDALVKETKKTIGNYRVFCIFEDGRRDYLEFENTTPVVAEHKAMRMLEVSEVVSVVKYG